MIIDIAFTSLPSHADKRALVVPKLRGPGLVRWAREGNHNVVGISELATISSSFIRLVPGLGLVCAKPNNVFGPIRICNALMYRKWLYTVVRVRDLNVPMPGRKRGLNMVAVLLENRQTGERFWVIVWHAPRKKLDPHTNVLVRREVILLAKELHKNTGHPVYPVGDSNDRRALAVFRRVGFRIPAEEEVTMIAALEDEDDRLVWGPDKGEHVRWSDHVALSVRGRSKKAA